MLYSSLLRNQGKTPSATLAVFDTRPVRPTCFLPSLKSLMTPATEFVENPVVVLKVAKAVAKLEFEIAAG